MISIPTGSGLGPLCTSPTGADPSDTSAFQLQSVKPTSTNGYKCRVSSAMAPVHSSVPWASAYHA